MVQKIEVRNAKGGRFISAESVGSVAVKHTTLTTSTNRKTFDRRHKRRRNKPPAGYEEWDDKDKQYYEDVSFSLRQWKAARIQCRLYRSNISLWEYVKYQFKGHPMHAAEMEEYKQTLETFVVLDSDQPLDFD